MKPVYYDSASIYIETATSLQGKITCIDNIIDGLLTNALKAVENDHISEYQLNDGQTIIKTVYRGAASVMKSIESYERLKQLYINKLNGRMVRLVDGKNFTNGCY